MGRTEPAGMMKPIPAKSISGKKVSVRKSSPIASKKCPRMKLARKRRQNPAYSPAAENALVCRDGLPDVEITDPDVGIGDPSTIECGRRHLGDEKLVRVNARSAPRPFLAHALTSLA